MRRLSTVYEENKAQIARILDLFGEGFTAMTELSVRGERFSLFCMRGIEGVSEAVELLKGYGAGVLLEKTYSLDKMIESVFAGKILILGESLSEAGLISEGRIGGEFSEWTMKNVAVVRSSVKGASVSVIPLKDEEGIYGAICYSEKFGGKETAIKTLKAVRRALSEVEGEGGASQRAAAKNSLLRPLSVKAEDGRRTAELLTMGRCVAFVDGETSGSVIRCGWGEIFTSENRGRWYRVYLQMLLWAALVLPSVFLLTVKSSYLFSLSPLWILLTFSVGELLFLMFRKDCLLFQSVFWLSASFGGFVSMPFVPTVLLTLILIRQQSREGELLVLMLCPIFLLMSAAFGYFGLVLSSAALGIVAILLERRSFLDRIGKR